MYRVLLTQLPSWSVFNREDGLANGLFGLIGAEELGEAGVVIRPGEPSLRGAGDASERSDANGALLRRDGSRGDMCGEGSECRNFGACCFGEAGAAAGFCASARSTELSEDTFGSADAGEGATERPAEACATESVFTACWAKELDTGGELRNTVPVHMYGAGDGVRRSFRSGEPGRPSDDTLFFRPKSPLMLDWILSVMLGVLRCGVVSANCNTEVGGDLFDGVRG